MSRSVAVLVTIPGVSGNVGILLTITLVLGSAAVLVTIHESVRKDNCPYYNTLMCPKM